MPCRSQWSIRVQITRLHPLPSSSASSIFLRLYLYPAVHISCCRCSWIALFLCDLSVSTIALVGEWRCCRHFSVCTCDQASNSIFFFLAAASLVLYQLFSLIVLWWRYTLRTIKSGSSLYICNHNFGRSRSIFKNDFCITVKRENCLLMYEKMSTSP